MPLARLSALPATTGRGSHRARRQVLPSRQAAFGAAAEHARESRSGALISLHGRRTDVDASHRLGTMAECASPYFSSTLTLLERIVQGPPPVDTHSCPTAHKTFLNKARAHDTSTCLRGKRGRMQPVSCFACRARFACCIASLQRHGICRWRITILPSNAALRFNHVQTMHVAGKLHDPT